MSKIFITGGSGFIGSNLARILVNKNHEVHIYDAFVQYTIPVNQITRTYYMIDFRNNKVNIIRGDVRTLSI